MKRKDVPKPNYQIEDSDSEREEEEEEEPPLKKGSGRPPAFEEKDLKGKYSEDETRFVNFAPRRFIPGVQPVIDLLSTITVYGKRRTGKSVWVKWVLQYYKQYFPWLWVFTKTRQNNHYRFLYFFFSRMESIYLGIGFFCLLCCVAQQPVPRVCFLFLSFLEWVSV